MKYENMSEEGTSQKNHEHDGSPLLRSRRPGNALPLHEQRKIVAKQTKAPPA
jgi:hypothetical protein